MKRLFSDEVILSPLEVGDADAFYKIYSHPSLAAQFDESPFLANETPAKFTERIISVCTYIFTIRLKNNPTLIVGDCALHHFDMHRKEIAVGGSLLPEYWGRGYMQSAFKLLIELATQELGVRALLASTRTSNSKAIRFMEKMGFNRHQSDESNTIMRREC